MIIRQGVIYRGPFEKNITVKNVPFIMDHNLTRINTLSFALLDHTNKQVYTWYKKESYNLYKYDKYYIRLKDDGEFSLTSSPLIRQLQNIYKLIDNRKRIGYLLRNPKTYKLIPIKNIRIDIIRMKVNTS